MPPAASPVQGSRAGLITALVISVIVAVTMIVVAIHTGQMLTASERDIKDLRDKDKPIYIEQDVTDPRVQALNALKDQPGFTGLPSDLQVAMAESEQIAKVVGGNTTPDKTPDFARTVLKDAEKKINDLNAKKLISFTLPADTLTSAIPALTDQVAQLASANLDKQNSLTAAQQKLDETIKAQKAQLDAKDKLIQDANAKAESAMADAKKYQDEATAATAALTASTAEGQKALQATNAGLTTQVQAKEKQNVTLAKQVKALITKLRSARVSAQEPIIQHADGIIIRITGNTCFINLGEREHVTKGLTFEVYDKYKGVPSLGDGLSDAGLPVGKASIEVFNIGPDSSECRIVKTQPGMQIVVGDMIANLIYDPSIQYNFVVYGNFDLTGSGVASTADADVIRRLITQWGGKVQDHIDVQTDFVIMGAEPVVSNVTDPNDPASVAHSDEQKKKHQAWVDVAAKAAELSVPIMNQNRFLYFIGYYDQAGR
jgi:predicted  nucleic acid-binding Zn-ribbon protein